MRGKGLTGRRWGECSARYVLALEIIRSFSVDILSVELAEEIDSSEDAFLAGIEYASEKLCLTQRPNDVGGYGY